MPGGSATAGASASSLAGSTRYTQCEGASDENTNMLVGCFDGKKMLKGEIQSRRTWRLSLSRKGGRKSLQIFLLVRLLGRGSLQMSLLEAQQLTNLDRACKRKRAVASTPGSTQAPKRHHNRHSMALVAGGDLQVTSFQLMTCIDLYKRRHVRMGNPGTLTKCQMMIHCHGSMSQILCRANFVRPVRTSLL